MDTNQLHELATNARLNHWPPHLGVTTEAEKIEYLAQQLEDAGSYKVQMGELAAENKALREELDSMTRRAEKAEYQLQKINDLSSK